MCVCVWGGGVPIAQLVEVTDCAVLGGVVAVLSLNPAVGHKYISVFTGIVDLLDLSKLIFITNLVPVSLNFLSLRFS